MQHHGPDLDARDWDPRDPSFRQDPIPWYRALREQSPVHFHDEAGVVVSRYRDVEQVLRDERFGVATPGPWREVAEANMPASMWMLSENMLLFIDPPQHSRVRSLVAKAFSPRRVEALRPRLTSLIDRLLDDLADTPRFDVMDAIAGPFPIIAITELLGVPDTDRHQLHDWTVAMSAVDDLPIEIEALPAAGRAADEFLAYADQLVERRRGRPGDDLISALIAAEDASPGLRQPRSRRLRRAGPVRYPPGRQPPPRLREGPALLHRRRARPTRRSDRPPRAAPPVPRSRAGRPTTNVAVHVRDPPARDASRLDGPDLVVGEPGPPVLHPLLAGEPTDITVAIEIHACPGVLVPQPRRRHPIDVVPLVRLGAAADDHDVIVVHQLVRLGAVALFVGRQGGSVERTGARPGGRSSE